MKNATTKLAITLVLCSVASGMAAWAQDAPAAPPATPKKAAVAYKAVSPKVTAKKAAPAKVPPKAIDPGEPPKTAASTADGSFSWTDAKGKRWNSRKTPFGWMRSEDTGMVADPSVGALDASVRVTDLGDNVRFEKPTPFGPTKWEKRKSDLTDGERAALERAANNRAKNEVVAK